MFHYSSLLLTFAPHPNSIVFPPAKLQITIISGNLDYRPKVETSLSKAIYIFLLSVLSGPPWTKGRLCIVGPYILLKAQEVVSVVQHPTFILPAELIKHQDCNLRRGAPFNPILAVGSAMFPVCHMVSDNPTAGTVTSLCQLEPLTSQVTWLSFAGKLTCKDTNLY